MKNKLPNIIWYCTDQQRHDTINALGNQYINTPNLNKFIKNGFAFKNYFCLSKRIVFNALIVGHPFGIVTLKVNSYVSKEKIIICLNH